MLLLKSRCCRAPVHLETMAGVILVVRISESGVERYSGKCSQCGRIRPVLKKTVTRAVARESERSDLIRQYGEISEAAVRGAGTTPHTARRLRALYGKIMKLGGFK